VLARTNHLMAEPNGSAGDRLARLTLSNEEIRALTGLGRDKVLELLRAGTIPSVRIGRRYLVTREHLDTFLGLPLHEA
jgi:excisionase family DNA binding protein